MGLREILIIALLIVLLFGARKIPQIMGDFAKGIRSFRQGLSEGDKDEAAEKAEAPRQIAGQPVQGGERAKTTEQ